MDKTIDMARKVKMPYDFVTGEPIYLEKLKAFEALVRADEREACAKFVEEKATGYEERAAQPKDVRDINPEVARIAVLACGQLAAAIRARGNT